MKKLQTLLTCGLISGTAAFGQSTILWDEAVNGPLSADFTSPSQFGTLTSGTNTVFGAVQFFPGSPGGGVQDDYFAFRVGDGSSLTAMFLMVDKSALAWLGDPSYSTEFGHAFTSIGGNLLAPFGLPFLSAGAYGMYMQNDDLGSPIASIVNYRLDFVVVPEPASLWLLLGGLSFGWVRIFRKCRVH